jgi:hypothetical protein
VHDEVGYGGRCVRVRRLRGRGHRDGSLGWDRAVGPRAGARPLPAGRRRRLERRARVARARRAVTGAPARRTDDVTLAGRARSRCTRGRACSPTRIPRSPTSATTGGAGERTSSAAYTARRGAPRRRRSGTPACQPPARRGARARRRHPAAAVRAEAPSPACSPSMAFA